MGHCEELCKDILLQTYVGLLQYFKNKKILFHFCLFCIDISIASKYASKYFLSLCTVQLILFAIILNTKCVFRIFV